MHKIKSFKALALGFTRNPMNTLNDGMNRLKCLPMYPCALYTTFTSFSPSLAGV